MSETTLILSQGSTIKDVALKIHKELYKVFTFAMVYRTANNQPEEEREFTKTVEPTRIKAGLNFQIEENNIIEIHSRI